MRFARIELFFLIWAVPVLLVFFIYGMRKRRWVLDRFSSRKGQDAIVSGRVGRRRRVKAGLLLTSMLLMILAMTGPRYGFRWEDVERKGVDIIVALDCSKSMLATDIRPTRLDRAKREVVDLLNMLQGDRVGLVAFAGTAFLQCPLTIDYETFHLFLGALTPDFLPAGGTRLNDAVSTALDGFNSRDNSEKAIIFITDGERTGEDPGEAVGRAVSEGVKIFTIGVGGTEGVPVPEAGGGLKKDRSGNIVMTRLDEDTLKKMAVETGGAYVRSVAGDRDLSEIYLGQIREKMSASTLTSSRRQVWNDRYQWFLGAAVLFLLIDLFLPAARKVGVFLLFSFIVWGGVPGVHAFDFKSSMEKGLEAYDEGAYDTALKQFIDSQLNDPDKPEIFYNIGNAYYRTGDFASALRSFGQALESRKPAVRKKAHYNKGNTHFRLNQYKEAIADYQAALELDPDDRDARVNLEYVKKKLAQQESEKQDDGKENKDGENGDQKKDGPPKEGDKQDQSGETSDAGEKKDMNKDGNGNQSEKQFGQEADPEEVPADPSPSTERPMKAPDPGSSEETPPSEAEKRNRQAERILNRLKDMPGKAMIPEYGKAPVEKDW